MTYHQELSTSPTGLKSRVGIVHTLLLGSDERQKHVERNLNRVDKDQSMLGGDELEVDSMDNWPDFPRTLACLEEVVLDLVADHCERIAVDQSQVCKEDSHKNWAPNDLVECDLHDDVLGCSSFNLFVEPVVKEVTRRSMVQETKG